MVEQTLKILQCENRKILKVCMVIPRFLVLAAKYQKELK